MRAEGSRTDFCSGTARGTGEDDREYVSSEAGALLGLSETWI